ncbi:hypothetical protein C8R44DRAFT_871741 [Mycena epipterygia]|nr:hypothetical protein C8R44DRAFT_871741 [Mycena epipterygia]
MHEFPGNPYAKSRVLPPSSTFTVPANPPILTKQIHAVHPDEFGYHRQGVLVVDPLKLRERNCRRLYSVIAAPIVSRDPKYFAESVLNNNYTFNSPSRALPIKRSRVPDHRSRPDRLDENVIVVAYTGTEDDAKRKLAIPRAVAFTSVMYLNVPGVEYAILHTGLAFAVPSVHRTGILAQLFVQLLQNTIPSGKTKILWLVI